MPEARGRAPAVRSPLAVPLRRPRPLISLEAVAQPPRGRLAPCIRRGAPEDSPMRTKPMDFVWILLVFATWFALNRWVLPRFGVNT